MLSSKSFHFVSFLSFVSACILGIFRHVFAHIVVFSYFLCLFARILVFCKLFHMLCALVSYRVFSCRFVSSHLSCLFARVIVSFHISGVF